MIWPKPFFCFDKSSTFCNCTRFLTPPTDSLYRFFKLILHFPVTRGVFPPMRSVCYHPIHCYVSVNSAKSPLPDALLGNRSLESLLSCRFSENMSMVSFLGWALRLHQESVLFLHFFFMFCPFLTRKVNFWSEKPLVVVWCTPTWFWPLPSTAEPLRFPWPCSKITALL